MKYVVYTLIVAMALAVGYLLGYVDGWDAGLGVRQAIL